MSYVKIDNPMKRDKTVQDYISRKNKIKENFKRERAHKLNTAIAQEKFFEPVTASQALTTEALKQLQDSVVQNQILPSPQPAITDGIINLDKFTQNALAGLKPAAYNVRWEGDKYYIGTKPIYFNDGKVLFDGIEYPATRGLLNLLMRKIPTDYDDNDIENYGSILDNGGAIYQSKNTPIDKNSIKWNKIVRPIWERLHPKRAKSADYKKAKRQAGNGVIFLSSDPDALVERLRLMLSSVRAGNTGIVRNESIAILDELLRMKHINATDYKTIL